ncbi:PIG-L family deacetylase [Ornithinicoccus halotolerans]|uniref:PIG-L family deacetylase n=1 Tax=Ornithinicoccus halotolerans TaxID=1748220 RepID=UPI001E42AEFA|nr:PIG-L family deacetylase [Ornithinicoccus halotolerans]
MRAPLLADEAPPARVLAVHAHPDDETLATGLALAHHARRGDEVHVVTCTLGEEGEVIPAVLADLEGDPRLAEHRHHELQAAMAVLGAHHHYLGGERPRWRDSGMAGSAAARHPRAFAAVPVVEAAAELGRLLARLRPAVVLTYDRHGGYRHPDHVQTHRVTVAAVAAMPLRERPRLLAALTPRSWAEEDRAWVLEHVRPRPARGWRDGLALPEADAPYPPSVVPDGEVTHAVGGTAALPEGTVALRDEALAHHRTQVALGEGWFALSNQVAARLPRREGYAELAPDALGHDEPEPPHPEAAR